MKRLQQITTTVILLLMAAGLPWRAGAEVRGVVQLYSQPELLKMIRENTHLSRVKNDDCQLVEDIKARAEILKIPAYQFLYGDMLAYGVCVDRDVRYGLLMIEDSANQGLPDGLEQLGRYYHTGRFFQKDNDRALRYLREAASLGHIGAQMQLIELFLEDVGSPRDYEDAYHWLHNAIIVDRKERKRAATLLAKLAERMPQKVVKRAKRPISK